MVGAGGLVDGEGAAEIALCEHGHLIAERQVVHGRLEGRHGIGQGLEQVGVIAADLGSENAVNRSTNRATPSPVSFLTK